VGTLKGLDQAMNCILSDCQERIYSADKPAIEERLETLFVRGDTIAVVGEFEEDETELEEFHSVQCEPLKKFE
jgi:U6 snRNA-associated Sm-like protein LSm8